MNRANWSVFNTGVSFDITMKLTWSHSHSPELGKHQRRDRVKRYLLPHSLVHGKRSHCNSRLLRLDLSEQRHELAGERRRIQRRDHRPETFERLYLDRQDARTGEKKLGLALQKTQQTYGNLDK